MGQDSVSSNSGVSNYSPQNQEHQVPPAVSSKNVPNDLTADIDLGLAISEFEFALSSIEAQLNQSSVKKSIKSVGEGSSNIDLVAQIAQLNAENVDLKARHAQMKIRLDLTLERLERLMDSQKEQAEISQKDDFQSSKAV